ncbi:MAG TPA: hypothetical protein DHU96_15865 [Actinobacteria bacterium]|nr:hypothetical protein [Actinomycetota bacterium]
MDGLVTDGYVIPGGPVSNGERALLIVEATDEHEGQDPAGRGPLGAGAAPAGRHDRAVGNLA